LQHVDVPVRAHCTLIGCTIKWPLKRRASYICKIVDEKLLQNNTYPTSFAKKHQEDILALHHELWSLKFPYLLLLATLIKLCVFNKCANAVWLTLYLSLYKSTLCHHKNETMSTTESSEIFQNFMHPNEVQ